EEAPLGGRVAQGDAPRLALEDQADAAQPALDGPDRRDRADRVELGRADVLGVRALRDREDLASGSAERRLDRAQRGRAPGRDRERDARKQNGVPQGNHRKRQRFRHRESSFLPAGAGGRAQDGYETGLPEKREPGGPDPPP